MTITAAAQPGPTAPDGPTGQLACWLAELDLGSVPETVRTRAKHVILDGIGCALIGAQLPWSRVAMQAVTALEGPGGSRIIGHGATAPAPAATLLNGTFIQGFELDDFHPLAPLHSAALVLPAVFATAEQLGTVTGARLLTAAIAGFEVGPRVGLALHGPQMLSRGWHSGSVFGTHSAAAAAGVLRGLTARQFEDALGLAATQSAGLMAAQFEAMSKRMHHGFAARNGLYAAALAAAGYTGIKRVFEQDYGGFLSVFGEGHAPDASAVAAGLGRRWEVERIMIKAYAAMGGLHSAIDAALQLRAQPGFDPASIESIDIHVADAIYRHGWWPPQRPLTPTGAQMNIGYAVAVALLDGQVLPGQFTAARMLSEDVWALLARTRAHLDDAFESDPASRFSARVTVTLTGRQRLSAGVEQPRGGPASPMTNADIVGKYRSLARRVIDSDRTAGIEAMVLGLDSIDDINPLLDLLAGPVAGALD